MKKILSLFVITLVSAFVLVGCKKAEETPAVPETPPVTNTPPANP